ncbi:TPA: hypothetical protein DIC38_01210 [Candidatus Nomurabacteria bacterium]|nr:MAG: hypothetical protein O210_OD1C00001G0487 [Parcubacteria bacterium RAAC4_OD1_1]HCY26288.1 hypothetical protein [Candidatus Nomurabacteria bacterium]
MKREEKTKSNIWQLCGGTIVIILMIIAMETREKIELKNSNEPALTGSMIEAKDSLNDVDSLKIFKIKKP